MRCVSRRQRRKVALTSSYCWHWHMRNKCNRGREGGQTPQLRRALFVQAVGASGARGGRRVPIRGIEVREGGHGWAGPGSRSALLVLAVGVIPRVLITKTSLGPPSVIYPRAATRRPRLLGFSLPNQHPLALFLLLEPALGCARAAVFTLVRITFNLPHGFLFPGTPDPCSPTRPSTPIPQAPGI